MYDPSHYNLHVSIVWFGLVFVRSGLYCGAVFKFTISIPTTYPDGGCPVSNVDSFICLLATVPSLFQYYTTQCRE